MPGRTATQPPRSWLFGAGFAPLAALLLASGLGLMSAGAYLLSGAFWTLLALWLSGPEKTIE